ncbi:MAG: hypothetical protein EON59_02995 [Alphaproteobacteria bacterium]|nr:MAG: hypothetical protein EON59_02995 [Alphaproteobacteria bacterium]
MKLVLTDSLFEAADDLHLLGLLHRALRKRCYLAVRSPNSIDYHRWRDGLPRERRDAWDRLLDWTLLDSTVHPLCTVEVIEGDVSDWAAKPPKLTATDAMDLIDQPFQILLENARYDRAFLLAMAGPAYRPLLERLETEGRLAFWGVGGLSELRLVVEQRVALRPGRRLSHWALFDSDAAAPGHVSDEARRAAASCRAVSIPFHRLERRAIENYVPMGALYDWADADRRWRDARRPLVQSFAQLDEAQRRHFHFKSGFSANPTQEEAALFATVPGAARQALRGGMSSADIGRLFHNDIRGRIRAQVDKDGAGVELAPSLARLMELLRVPHG